jgi:predicted transposase YbfD/YdcC
LFEQIAGTMADSRNIASRYITMEVSRGRTEWRATSVSNVIDHISKDWKGLAQLVCVHRMVVEKGHRSEETAYSISSRISNAFLYAEGIRGHWGIENSLHYVKDVTFEEDASKIRTGNAPQNMSTIKNICIDILRKQYPNNMAQAIRFVAHDMELLTKMTA